MGNQDFLIHAKEWQLDNLPYEVMWMSKEGRIEYINKALCDSLGYSQKEADELYIFDINPRTSEESWEKHWEEVAKKKQVNFKTVHRKKEGILYDVEVFAQFFSNNGKELIFSIVSEITKSSFYQRVLNTTEQIASIGGWKLNLQDKSMIATDESLRIFGVKEAEDMRPINIQRFFKDPERFEELITLLITKAQPFDEIMEVLTQEGKHLWLRCAAQAILIEDKITKIIGIYQNVTEAYENTLSLRLYKEVIDQSEDIVLIYDEAGKLFDYSNSAVKQLGYTKKEFSDTSVFDLDPQAYPEWWKDHFEEIRKKKNFRLEWKASRKDGSQFPVDISVNLVRYQGQDLNCAILRDISDRKKHESELEHALEEIKDLKDQLELENEYLQEEIRQNLNFDNIICESESYAKVLKTVEQVAPTDTSVLITGESGTGKELLANALHQHSQRKNHVLIKVNCATIPKDLFESELFGHKKGAFTGASADKEGKFSLANGGTIFLDEIGEIPLELQAKLLRVLQEGEFDILGGKTMKVDARVVAATNRSLEQMIQEGTFREDLYYRLNVFPIHNIPLRERREDIAPLAQFFLKKYAVKAGKSFKRISKKTLALLNKYSFPGNIRELENLIERAVILEEGKTLYPGSWLPDVSMIPLKPKGFRSFEEMQREHIIKALEKTSGKVSGPGGAAELLQLKDKTLFAKMKKLGIEKRVIISKLSKKN